MDPRDDMSSTTAARTDRPVEVGGVISWGRNEIIHESAERNVEMIPEEENQSCPLGHVTRLDQGV